MYFFLGKPYTKKHIEAKPKNNVIESVKTSLNPVIRNNTKKDKIE